MTIKHLLMLLLSVCLSGLYGQGAESSTYSATSYLVKFKSDIKPREKANYLKEMNSSIIYETRTPGLDISYLEFNSFPFDLPGGKIIIDINGGIGTANGRPETDGAGYDYWTSIGIGDQSKPLDCLRRFSLVMPIGDNPVTIYNIDTGMDQICDNSTGSYNFCGNITCGSVPFNINTDCIDENGHGAHGSGLQISLINKSKEQFMTSGNINIVSYKVFGTGGQSTIGPVIAALDEIASEPGAHKVINNSFSFYGTWDYSGQAFDPLYEAYIALGQNNVLSVMSAGNDGFKLDGPIKAFPICYFSDEFEEHLDLAYTTIGVGATSCKNRPAPYSNFSSSEVDVSTLGTAYGPKIGGSNNVFYKGTSQAAFYTSAVAAMLMSHQDIPNLEHIKCALINSSDQVNGWENYNLAGGIMNALNAFEYLSSGIGINGCRSVVLDNTLTSNELTLKSAHSGMNYMDIKVSPNPFSDQINIQIASVEKSTVEISVIDFVGRVILTQNQSLEQGNNHIELPNVSELQDGIYLIQVKNGLKISTKKVLKYN